MKAITLRNLPPEVARLVQRRAREKRTSINKAIIELLEERSGTARKRSRALYDDLDHLAGSWTREEAAAFEQVLKEQRTIDPDVWE
jgi:hypothetical protein